MKAKWIAMFMAAVMVCTMTACGEEKETTTQTITGMVTAVEGTQITLVEMDTGSMGGGDFAEGNRPPMPEGMEGFQGFGDFDPENFEGTLPEGETMPQWGEGEMPQWGEGEMPQMPEGMTPPDGTMPEGFDGTMPEGGQRPEFDGENGGFNLEEFTAGKETKTLDISNAHISLETDGVRESGSVEDVVVGVFVTVTVNGKGKVTNVLVTSRSSFGGNRPNRQENNSL